jgi:ATP-binding cassette subfamily B protein/subfamily B ATP-binding cassette protein MsbA
MATTSAVAPAAPAGGAGLFRAVRRFVPYLRPYYPRFALVLTLLVAVSLASLGQMYLVMLGLDRIVHMGADMPAMSAHDHGQMVGAFAGDLRAVGLVALGFVGIQLAVTVARTVNTVNMARVIELLSSSLRRDLLRRLHRLTLDAHRQQSGGEWITRVLFDVDRLRSLLSGALLQTVYNLLFLAAASAFLLAINPRITLPVVAIIPVMALVSYRWSRRLQPAYEEQQRAWDRVVGYMTERLEGLRDVVTFGRQEQELASLDRLATGYRDLHVATSYKRATLSAFLEVCTFFVTGLLIWFGGLQFLSAASGAPDSVFAGARALMPMTWMLLGVDKMMASMGMAEGAALSAGALSAFVLFAGRMVSPVRGLSHQYGELAQIQVSAARVLEILDRDEERTAGRELPPLRGRIALEDVTFGYDPERPVLHEVSLVIEPGQHVALVGPTGAGKTTLTHLLSRFYEPDRGRVVVDGVDLREVSLASLRRQVISVAQETELFDGTVLENIRFGRPDASDEQVVAAAAAVGVHELLLALPRGYQTQLGEAGARLSAGQRQLVALARAMLADPRVVILDEAVSSVDPATRDAVVGALRRLLEGRTALMVAHQLGLASQADEVLVLEDGRIVESGPPAALLARGGRFADLWRAQGGGPTQGRELTAT